ncbi:MAG: lysophospholipase [Treponema sp.]|jgi:alpha-beta hydrolase superfamily lysophospholipase|nr:lysophospholipase [Treponema sp.]
MIEKQSFFETPDKTKLCLYQWSPDKGETSAVVHIVHGMAEHAFRYKRLAERLTGARIEVWAADQRGHGKTADLSINGPEKGGLLGHCADGDGFLKVTGDIHALNAEILKTRNVPLFLMGHSWGSFLVQNYIEEHSDSKLTGCILSGTRGPDGFQVKAGAPFMILLAALRGQRNGSRLAKAMADGPYNAPFKPNRTDFDWISRDEEEVDKYVADPLCGFLCSVGFYRDLAKGLNRIHQEKAMEKINRLLPIYIFSGDSDPVGNMGASPGALVKKYRELGVKNAEFMLYPGARHETLNETNRAEVTDKLLAWIQKHCGKK